MNRQGRQERKPPKLFLALLAVHPFCLRLFNPLEQLRRRVIIVDVSMLDSESAGSSESLQQAESSGPAAKLWKAGELARRTGLTRQSLHQYVLLGLLVPVEMTRGGQRLFSADAVERVKLIRSLVANGYTLRDIREIFFKKQS